MHFDLSMAFDEDYDYSQGDRGEIENIYDRTNHRRGPGRTVTVIRIGASLLLTFCVTINRIKFFFKIDHYSTLEFSIAVLLL